VRAVRVVPLCNLQKKNPVQKEKCKGTKKPSAHLEGDGCGLATKDPSHSIGEGVCYEDPSHSFREQMGCKRRRPFRLGNRGGIGCTELSCLFGEPRRWWWVTKCSYSFGKGGVMASVGGWAVGEPSCLIGKGRWMMVGVSG